MSSKLSKCSLPSLPSRTGLCHHSIAPLHLSYATRRSQSTSRRTTQRLRIRPAPSFTPAAGMDKDHIIFNPPSSAPSVYHTPLKFLPKGDGRRELYAATQAVAESISSGGGSVTAEPGTPASAAHHFPSSSSSSSSAETLKPLRPNPLPPGSSSDIASASLPAAPTTVTATDDRDLPPPIRPPYEKKYHLTEADIAEIRRLRKTDPRSWPLLRLADKFQCSKFFVSRVVQAPEMQAEHEQKQEERMKMWGRKKREAREDRERRKEAWGRD